MEQAKKPQFTFMQKVMVGLTLSYAVFLLFSLGSAKSPGMQAAPAPRHFTVSPERATAECARIAGLDPNDGKHLITKVEMAVLAGCIEHWKLTEGLR